MADIDDYRSGFGSSPDGISKNIHDMSKSNVGFHRWKHVQNHTWPFQVYKLYNEELSRFLWANEAASKYTFSKLGKDGADDNDAPTKHFSLPAHRISSMKTIKGWADVYDDSKNWQRLNCVMAISSNMETYLASVVALAIESNPSVLVGASQYIDGAKLLKEGGLDEKVYDNNVTACSKGAWPDRLAAFEKLFGPAPQSYHDGLTTLERMRKLRNNLGHAFGRDIDASRNFSFNKKQEVDRIQLQTLVKYLDKAYNIIQDVDEFLLDNHIGEFQAIYAYHMHRDEFMGGEIDRALKLKQFYGEHDQSVGKTFCKGLVSYYESL